MLIGVMGDSHDRLLSIKKSVRFFNKKETELVIHTGDFISPFVEKPFSDLNCELKGVFGNNDGERKGLSNSIDVEKEYLELEIKNSDGDKVNLFVLHGVNQSIVNALAKSDNYDFILRVHTHNPSIDCKENSTWVINPGESSGYLTNVMSVALLDINDKKITIHDLETEEVLLKEEYD